MALRVSWGAAMVVRAVLRMLFVASLEVRPGSCGPRWGLQLWILLPSVVDPSARSPRQLPDGIGVRGHGPGRNSCVAFADVDDDGRHDLLESA